MSKKKPSHVAYQHTYMGVEALTRHEKKSKPFMRIERGTQATPTNKVEAPKEKKEDK